MSRPQRQLRPTRLLRPHLHLPQRLETQTTPAAFNLYPSPKTLTAKRAPSPPAPPVAAGAAGQPLRLSLPARSPLWLPLFLPPASVHVVIPREARPILPRRRGISPRFLRPIAPNTQRKRLRFTLDNAVATTKKKSLRNGGGSPFSVPALRAKARSTSKLMRQSGQRLGRFQLLRLLQGFLCHGGSSGLASPFSF